MVTRIRQAVSLAHHMEEAAALYSGVLGIEVSWRTELRNFGLDKLVMPTGRETFLEILQPVDQQSRAWRFLNQERAHGSKYFSLIVETDDLDAILARADRAGARISSRSEGPENKSAFMHPMGMNGVLIEILQPPPGTWPNAGPEETQQVAPGALVSQLRQVVVLVRDLDEAIHRWTTLFDLKVSNRLRTSYGDLEAAILPFGKTGTFVELAKPATTDSAAARYLEAFEAKGIDAGLYLAIFETPDLDAAERAIRAQGEAEITQRSENGSMTRSLWLHPRSMKDVFIQLTQVLSPDNPWPEAGDEWHK